MVFTIWINQHKGGKGVEKNHIKITELNVIENVNKHEARINDLENKIEETNKAYNRMLVFLAVVIIIKFLIS